MTVFYARWMMRLWMRIMAYRGGVPFREELFPDGVEFEDFCLVDSAGSECADAVDGESCSSVFGCEVHTTFADGWILSKPADMTLFVRSLPRLELKKSRIRFSSAIMPELTPFIEHCARENPAWEVRRHEDGAVYYIAAPLTSANAEALANMINQYPGLPYASTIGLQRGRAPIHELLHEHRDGFELDPFVPEFNVAAFCRSVGCT